MKMYQELSGAINLSQEVEELTRLHNGGIKVSSQGVVDMYVNKLLDTFPKNSNFSELHLDKINTNCDLFAFTILGVNSPKSVYTVVVKPSFMFDFIVTVEGMNASVMSELHNMVHTWLSSETK